MMTNVFMIGWLAMVSAGRLISAKRATVTEAANELTTDQAKRFILLIEETVPNKQGGESVVVLTNPSLPHELRW
jgi:hypothetical protein